MSEFRSPATRDSDTGYVFNKDTGAWFSWPGNGTIRSKDKAHLFHYGEIKGWISGYAMLEWQPEVVASEIEEKQMHKCPTCESPNPAHHPAVQFEGEVSLCRDPWHKPTAAEIESSLSADSFGSSEYFKGTLPPHQYPTEEAIERAKILTGPDAPGFDKPWALAIMRGLLAGLSAPSSASENWRELAHEAFLQLEYLHQREQQHSTTEALLIRMADRLGFPLEAKPIPQAPRSASGTITLPRDLPLKLLEAMGAMDGYEVREKEVFPYQRYRDYWDALVSAADSRREDGSR